MAFPAQNQTFQKGSFTGYKVMGARRVANHFFDGRRSQNDPYRSVWQTDETSYGPNFAVLDGVGLRGTNKAIDSNGLRGSSSGVVNCSRWTIPAGNGMAIQGGQGAYLRCPVDLDPGFGVRFVWRFSTSLASIDTGSEYVGFAIARFLDKNLNPVTGSDGSHYELLCTSRDLPGFIHNSSSALLGKLETDGWASHSLIHTGAGRLDGYVEWVVSSGHYFQPSGPSNATKASAYPCCLAIDHIVLI